MHLLIICYSFFISRIKKKRSSFWTDRIICHSRVRSDDDTRNFLFFLHSPGQSRNTEVICLSFISTWLDKVSFFFFSSFEEKKTKKYCRLECICSTSHLNPLVQFISKWIDHSFFLSLSPSCRLYNIDWIETYVDWAFGFFF